MEYFCVVIFYLSYRYFHIYVIKLISLEYSLSDLYRNDPSSGKSLQRASNLQQGKSKLRCRSKVYLILINRFRIQINVYNYHLTYNVIQIPVYKPQVLRFQNKFYKLLKSKFLLLKTFVLLAMHQNANSGTFLPYFLFFS